MSDDPKYRNDAPPGGMPDDLNESDRAMLSAVSHRQRDTTPLSLDQERLLNSWIAGRLSSKEADRAAELTRSNKFAAEHILERRLIAAADEGPDVPSTLSARILRESRSPKSRSIFKFRLPLISNWQWSGFGAAAAAIAVVAVFGFQALHTQLQSDQRFQIAMATIEDRSVLSGEGQYRTRGTHQGALAPDSSSTQKPAEGHFRDIEVPTTLLRRAIQGASSDKGELEYSDLMSYLRTQTDSLDSRARIVIDSALSDVASKISTERGSTQIRVYDLDDPRSFPIRGKIKTLPADAPAIFLTSRQ
jgi:hypothetical protein